MLRRALWAGALAGLLVGGGDALAAWGRMGQFVPGAGGKLRALLLAATLTGLATSLLAFAGAALVLALARGTVLGPLVRHARAQHTGARLRDPREALVGLSLAIAALPALGGALALAYQIGFHAIATRKHKGLVIAVAMAATVGALAVGVLVMFALARLIELALRRLLRGRALALASHWLAPAVAAGGLTVLGALVAYLGFRKPLSLDQLQLRPIVIGALLPAALAGNWPLAPRLLARLDRLPRAARRAADVALPVVLLLLALLAGRAEGARKAVTAYTGLSGPIVNGLRRAVDMDRDGYSPLFGGGDCNDWQRDVHPGAFDVPDDGVDQNCMGGDLKLARSPADAHFAPRPPGIPADFNVILITVDALRPDHLGAYGYARPTSPTIDALAAEGGVFENAWAHAPSTRYSVPAILTGRYPSQVLWDPQAHDDSWWPGLSLDNHTIAEIMKEAGLTTGAILSYRYFNPVRRMNQGFDHYDNENARLHAGSDPAATSGSSAREQSDKAIAYVDSVADRRFFLWVHYYDPHYRYDRHPGTQEFGGAPVDLYDHEIRFTDEQIARLFAELRARGVWDKTVIVITGDHGEGFGEHHIDFHGYHLYAAQTRVPLIIKIPGLPPRRLTTPVAHVDLLPTLANLMGAPADASMLGRSVLGELAGMDGFDPDADHDVYQEVSFEGPTERRAVASKRWHLLYNMVPDNTWELYDLAADPAEAHDVWSRAGDQVAALRARLQSWIDAAQFPPGAAEKLGAALLDARPTPANPADASWGGKVRLLGWQAPAEAHAGDTIDVIYFFEALGRLDGDWRFFVHIEGPTRFTDDHVPVDGIYPFARWTSGQFIADARRVTIPPQTRPGEYTLFVGLWQPKKGNLALTGGGDGRVRLGTLRIVP